MQQDHVCKYCGKGFHRESTLATHVCVKKRRHMEASATGPRLGLQVFVRFYQITAISKKTKTLDEFVESQFYIDFVKFGHHLSNLKPLYTDRFIDFVITTGVKIKDWTRDYVYDLYIDDLVKREPADAGTERSIANIIEWCDANGCEFTDFFSTVNVNQAAHMIKTGRISPWVMYLSDTGDALMSRFNEDHARLIGNIIDPSIWMKKFKQLPDEVEYIKGLLWQVGL